MKNEIQNKPKHNGNYELSVSFDMFGDDTSSHAYSQVDALDKEIRKVFMAWKKRVEEMKHLNIRIENVEWND